MGLWATANPFLLRIYGFPRLVGVNTCLTLHKDVVGF